MEQNQKYILVGGIGLVIALTIISFQLVIMLVIGGGIGYVLIQKYIKKQDEKFRSKIPQEFIERTEKEHERDLKSASRTPQPTKKKIKSKIKKNVTRKTKKKKA